MKKIKKLNFIGTVQKDNILLLFLLFLLTLVLCPGNAFAGGGVTEFAGPLEKVIGILQGPLGLAIAIVCLVIVFIGLAIKGSEVGETLKILVEWVIPISGVCSAGSFVTYLFQFTGAVIV